MIPLILPSVAEIVTFNAFCTNIIACLGKLTWKLSSKLVGLYFVCWYLWFAFIQVTIFGLHFITIILDTAHFRRSVVTTYLACPWTGDIIHWTMFKQKNLNFYTINSVKIVEKKLLNILPSFLNLDDMVRNNLYWRQWISSLSRNFNLSFTLGSSINDVT